MGTIAAGKDRRLSLRHGALISIFVHSLLAAPLFLPDPSPRKPARNEKLRIEVFGMIAERQTAQKQPEVAAPAPPNPPRPQETERKKAPEPERKREVAPQKPTPRVKAIQADSPVRMAEQTPAAAPPSTPTVTPSSPVKTEQQIQRTIRPQSDAEYAACVGKKLRDNRVYPQEARKAGLDGIVTIGFIVMENGALRAETLRVVKSSGYPILDKSALSTALASAPFEPPPREVPIIVDVMFGARN